MGRAPFRIFCREKVDHNDRRTTCGRQLFVMFLFLLWNDYLLFSCYAEFIQLCVWCVFSLLFLFRSVSERFSQGVQNKWMDLLSDGQNKKRKAILSCVIKSIIHIQIDCKVTVFYALFWHLDKCIDLNTCIINESKC